MNAYARRAVELGLSGIVFLDHLTLRPDDRRSSMAEEEVGLYYGAVRRLARLYRGRLEILSGLEIDHNPEWNPRARELAERFAFDVVTASVHFSGDMSFVSRKSAGRNRDVPDDAFADAYFAALDSMLDDPFFDVVGHVDVLKKFGRKISPELAGRFRKLFSRMAALNLVMEMNTSGFDHPAAEPYPGETLLRLAAEAGLPVCLGSDAHAPEQVGRHFGDATRLLARCGHTRLTQLVGRKARFISLDAA